MNISEYEDLVSWMRNNNDRRATCQSIYDNDDLRRAIREGGIKVNKLSKRYGFTTFEEYEFIKSTSFSFDYNTYEYSY